MKTKIQKKVNIENMCMSTEHAIRISSIMSSVCMPLLTLLLLRQVSLFAGTFRVDTSDLIIVAIPYIFFCFAIFMLDTSKDAIKENAYKLGFDGFNSFCNYYSAKYKETPVDELRKPSVSPYYDFYYTINPNDLPYMLKDIKKVAVKGLFKKIFPTALMLYISYYFYAQNKLFIGWCATFIAGFVIPYLMILPTEKNLLTRCMMDAITEKYKFKKGFNKYVREYKYDFFGRKIDPLDEGTQYYQTYNEEDFIIDINNKHHNKSYSKPYNKPNTNTKAEDVKIPEKWKKKHKQEPKTKQQMLNDALSELDGLVGLNEVKTQVRRFLATMQAYKKKKVAGFKVETPSLHMVFAGPPGTGKTTVARIMAKLLKAMGFLSSGHLVETDRSGLVAGYIGQTALKTQEVINKAKGGILFIDEAYSLAGGSENDFGKEAVAALIKAMEDNRSSMVIIFAGYQAEMEKFLDMNPGLRSRVPYRFNFRDYSPEDIKEIVLRLLKKKKYSIETEAQKLIGQVISEFTKADGIISGSGRFARNLMERIEEAQNVRIGFENVSNKELMKILREDVIEAYKSIKENSN